ncbi:hypothetical protein KFK09_026652 [Dendrobium nobile]|uniref:RRM domain-containing protein n=1 Tax=Dendrobium nobile TaxID=94219 RepID=A0A8T3A8R9_DENNO|nr:hypothetical protein KFK09_026652 [Dendrobium nobile]
MAYRPPVPVSASGSVSGSSSSSGFHFFNSPFGDTTYTKVFVGGLAWETHSETLQRHFEQFGDILEAVVISDKNTGRSKGYGFVTFRHPESASRACANPSPIIDGRRANCNLASLGRPRPAPPYAHLRTPSPYVGGLPIPRGAYIGGSTYHHQVLPYNYQHPISYPSVGYTAYGPEYAYPQSIHNPLMSQQYVQIYGVPGALNTAIYPYGQLSQPISIAQGFATMQGYTVPGHPFMQPGHSINGLTASPRPANQAPYPRVVIPAPAQPQFIIPANSSQYIYGSGSDHAAS